MIGAPRGAAWTAATTSTFPNSRGSRLAAVAGKLDGSRPAKKEKSFDNGFIDDRGYCFLYGLRRPGLPAAG